MNDTAATTSQPGASLLPEGTGAITTVHFVLIALVALLALAMIVRGIRKSRERARTARAVEAHAEEAGAPLDAPVETPAAEHLAPAPTPVEPAMPFRTEPPFTPAPASPIADKTIAAAAPLDATPASMPADEPAAPVVAAPDAADGRVTQLKGLGPKVAARLTELGVTTVGQIAALDDARAADLDAQLGTFRGRLTRDRWVEQARFLAAGDRAGFEAVFGRL